MRCASWSLPASGIPDTNRLRPYDVSADGRTVAEFAGSTVLGLRRGGLVAGICRFVPAAGRIDAPGLVTGQRDQAGYRMLLTAALSRITAGQVIVESWGDGPGRVRACGQLGLMTRLAVPLDRLRRTSLTRRRLRGWPPPPVPGESGLAQRPSAHHIATLSSRIVMWECWTRPA